MLHDKDIICISSIDWDFIWQGHQEIMSVLAKNGNRVLFIENTGVRTPSFKDIPRLWSRFINWKKGFKGIRKERENLYVYSPLALPFPHSKAAIKINKMILLSAIKKWMKIMEFHNPVVWSFLPTGIVLNLIDELDPGIFIYYCIDDFVSSSKGARRIKKMEEKVIKRADIVFTTSHKLYERCISLNSRTFLFPFGVSIENYNNIREKNIDKPDDIKNINRPIIGYVGGLHKWVDIGLLKNIAVKNKHIAIVLIGPKQADLFGIDKLENIYILGKKEGKDLPKYIKFFDAGIIPYKQTAYTENVYPTKINEYLAMGKPVLSTPIPEVEAFNRENGGNFIHFISDPDDVENVIKEALNPPEKDILNKMITVANNNSWAEKIEKMCGLIDNRLKEIDISMNRDWLKRFKRFYGTARKKIIVLTGTLAAAYFILFYSPLLWWIASPLKIDQNPQKVDAIVVFGGGVGESGSPGKSTIERARYSVDLYKEGFSKFIIYSSGYGYKYNDAENMRLIATSMNVPGDKIILDQKGSFTYENVKCVSEILKNKGFHSIILISSPYNMRRASFVFRHISKDVNVIYSPVPSPEFFRKSTALRWEQIRAILHEYLGIVYYFFKGYI